MLGKVAAGFAVTGIILSIIAGGIAGVPLFTIILRSLLSGVVFGGIGAGAYVLIQQQLPELLEDSEASSSIDEDDVSNTVDIVLDDKNPDIYSQGNEEQGDSEYGNEESEEQSDEGDGFVEEVEEISSVPNGKGLSNLGDNDENYDKKEEVDVLENVDALPDLGQFSDSFAGFDGEGGDDENDGGSSGNSSRFQPMDLGSSSETIDVMGDKKRPEEIAQAVKTFLNKDQKG
ncbi:MAG: hypothetical protein ACLFR1_00575 [Spirochaetia bacterium]